MATGYQNRRHDTQADGPNHPGKQAGIGVIQKIAEHDRRDDTADVAADGNEAEYFAHLPGRRDRPNCECRYTEYFNNPAKLPSDFPIGILDGQLYGKRCFVVESGDDFGNAECK